MSTRQEDTRRKIQLGGLVIKAGMADYPAAVILGALAIAANALQGQSGPILKARCAAAGDALFSKNGNRS